jgi:hypothetical protein
MSFDVGIVEVEANLPLDVFPEDVGRLDRRFLCRHVESPVLSLQTLQQRRLRPGKCSRYAVAQPAHVAPVSERFGGIFAANRSIRIMKFLTLPHATSALARLLQCGHLGLFDIRHVSRLRINFEISPIWLAAFEILGRPEVGVVF